MDQIHQLLNDPDIMSSLLLALFLVNAVLTISLAFRSLDPVRAEGLVAAILSVVSFVVCANILEGRELFVAAIQSGQLVILLILNIVYRRPAIPRRSPVADDAGAADTSDF